jgi:Nucleoside 2-deoxyribosyltransferase like
MLSSIYLTGGTIDAQEVVGLGPIDDWRSLALTRLQRYGLKVVNPLELAWNEDFRSELSDGVKQRVSRSLELIDQCDGLLANLNRSSYATAMEIFYAHRRGKVVTVVGQTPFSPWVLLHSQARFGDVEHALDYIIEEQPQITPFHWALQHEGYLAERYEQLPPSGEPDYQFVGGDMPVMLVAPHATAFWRDGEFQEADAFTGTIAALLSRTCRSHAFYSNYCCVADPCLYLETPFRRAFADIVRTGQIGLVIFLVGSPWHETPGLRIYADDRSEDFASRLRLKLMAVEPVSKVGLEDNLGKLHRFASEELGVQAITLKMHKRYRMPRLQPETFMELTGALQEFVIEVGSELSRSSA